MGSVIMILLAVFGGTAAYRPAPPPPPQATAPESEGEGAAAGAAGTGRALVVGDSLAEGTEAPLAELLPGWRIATSAYTGRPTADGVSEITGRGNLPGVLVVSLGTNDDPSAVSTFQSQIEAVMEATGPSRCVIWANIVRPPYGGVSYAGYNRALAAAAVAHPNLLILDWVGLVKGNPGVLAPDGVHATPDGYALRAQAVAAAMQSCASGTYFGGSSGAVGD